MIDNKIPNELAFFSPFAASKHCKQKPINKATNLFLCCGHKTLDEVKKKYSTEFIKAI